MRIKRLASLIFLLLTFPVLTACAGADGPAGNARHAEAERVIIITDDERHEFFVEVADDDDERRLGLMYRTELAPNAGMLFDFGETQHISMWMKNTLIPLDMAFIDASGEIKRIAANTTPRSLESVRSGEPVVAVLEVNGGTFERLGVKAGDRVAHSMFQSQD
ncbi:MAG: DUF192 domain-containing protein [Hyphococcus sp.]